jgi:hypothetical protein
VRPAPPPTPPIPYPGLAGFVGNIFLYRHQQTNSKYARRGCLPCGCPAEALHGLDDYDVDVKVLETHEHGVLPIQGSAQGGELHCTLKALSARIIMAYCHWRGQLSAGGGISRWASPRPPHLGDYRSKVCAHGCLFVQSFLCSLNIVARSACWAPGHPSPQG